MISAGNLSLVLLVDLVISIGHVVAAVLVALAVLTSPVSVEVLLIVLLLMHLGSGRIVILCCLKAAQTTK